MRYELALHGICGDSETDLPVVTNDALAGKHGEYDLMLAIQRLEVSGPFRGGGYVRSVSAPRTQHRRARDVPPPVVRS